MNISIAMTTYNGEKFIKQQIESILTQINSEDEIIISDDGSTDNTLNIIKDYSNNYPQIKIYKGPKKGTAKNFENAISHCTNEIIFLSDQDDIWEKNKIGELKVIFDGNSNVNIVLHNGIHFYENDKNRSKKIILKYRKGVLSNVIKSNYWGCCMAFRKEFITKYLPFKKNECAHDQLIGLIGEKEKCVFYLDKELIKHRIHLNNVSKSNITVLKKIEFRLKIYGDYIKCYYIK